MKPKKLLLIIPSMHLGGTESHVGQILPGLMTHGWDISVYLTSGTGELLSKLTDAGITVRSPNKLSIYLHNRSKILRAPLLLFTFIDLLFYLLLKKPNIVQFMLPEAYIIGGLSCVLTGQKNLVMGRRSLNNYQNKYPLFAKIEHWLHTKMQYIITNSLANILQLQQSEQVPPEKLKLIYNGIDTNRFSNLTRFEPSMIRNKFKLADSSFGMLVIANIIPYKGHAILLRALQQISSQLPADWQLICVGKKYDYVHELQQLAAELNIAKHINWLGTQQDIEQLLAITNIVISASLEEGFSNSIIEAMAAGLPVVATRVGGNPEAVVDGQTGLIVQANNPDSLATAILTLSKNTNLQTSMGSAGKQRVNELFALSTCVKNYNQLYTEMLRTT